MLLVIQKKKKKKKKRFKNLNFLIKQPPKEQKFLTFLNFIDSNLLRKLVEMN